MADYTTRAKRAVGQAAGTVKRYATQVPNILGGVYTNLDRKVGGVLPNGAPVAPALQQLGRAIKKVNDVKEGIEMTATEAVPAIAAGGLGISRTDRRIDPRMMESIQTAVDTARADGRQYVTYEDYPNNAGGMGGRYTMGRIDFSEMSFDDAGKVTGLTQVFNTDKTPGEAMSEFNIRNPRTYYKPAEAALAGVQDRGVTTHDIKFK